MVAVVADASASRMSHSLHLYSGYPDGLLGAETVGAAAEVVKDVTSEGSRKAD